MNVLGPFNFGGTIIASPGSSVVLPKSECQNSPWVWRLITVPSARMRKTRFVSAWRVGPPASFRYELSRFFLLIAESILVVDRARDLHGVQLRRNVERVPIFERERGNVFDTARHRVSLPGPRAQLAELRQVARSMPAGSSTVPAVPLCWTCQRWKSPHCAPAGLSASARSIA